MELEFNNLIDFNKFIGIARPLDNDFDAGRLEDLKAELSGNPFPPFRHRFYSICMATNLDMELNVGYYKRTPRVPYLLFKSPYQTMSWQFQPGIKSGWHLIFTENFMIRNPKLANIIQEFAFLQLDKAIPFEIKDQDTQTLEEIFLKITNEYHSDQDDRFELIASYIQLLLLQIRRLYTTFVSNDEEIRTLTNRNDAILFSRFKNLLISNKPPFSFDIKNLTYFADQLAVHANYLNAVLKRVTGEHALAFLHKHIMNGTNYLKTHASKPDTFI